jgi:hypothetical protein
MMNIHIQLLFELIIIKYSQEMTNNYKLNIHKKKKKNKINTKNERKKMGTNERNERILSSPLKLT